jgi:hypothetical protein
MQYTLLNVDDREEFSLDLAWDALQLGIEPQSNLAKGRDRAREQRYAEMAGTEAVKRGS